MSEIEWGWSDLCCDKFQSCCFTSWFKTCYVCDCQPGSSANPDDQQEIEGQVHSVFAEPESWELGGGVDRMVFHDIGVYSFGFIYLQKLVKTCRFSITCETLIMRFHVWLILYNTSRDAHMSRDNFESSITSRSYPACECAPKSMSNICNFNQSYWVSQTTRFLIMIIFLCFTFEFIMRGRKIFNHSDALLFWLFRCCDPIYGVAPKLLFCDNS